MAETAIWTRLEPLNRLPDRLDRSLSAQILDPLTLIAVQSPSPQPPSQCLLHVWLQAMGVFHRIELDQAR